MLGNGRARALLCRGHPMASRVGATVAAASAVAVLLGVPVSTAAPVLRLIPYASGFTLPIGFFQDPTDSRVQFVLQPGGVVQFTQVPSAPTGLRIIR